MDNPLKAELAGIQATLDASLQREREANERIADLRAKLAATADQYRHEQVSWLGEISSLKADLSARMSQLNEARAATVDCNMALADANERAAAANERADANLRLRMDVLATYVSKEREVCAALVDARANQIHDAGIQDGLKDIAAAIRSRKS